MSSPAITHKITIEKIRVAYTSEIAEFVMKNFSDMSPLVFDHNVQNNSLTFYFNSTHHAKLLGLYKDVLKWFGENYKVNEVVNCCDKKQNSNNNLTATTNTIFSAPSIKPVESFDTSSISGGSLLFSTQVKTETSNVKNQNTGNIAGILENNINKTWGDLSQTVLEKEQENIRLQKVLSNALYNNPSDSKNVTEKCEKNLSPVNNSPKNIPSYIDQRYTRPLPTGPYPFPTKTDKEVNSIPLVWNTNCESSTKSNIEVKSSFKIEAKQNVPATVPSENVIQAVPKPVTQIASPPVVIETPKVNNEIVNNSSVKDETNNTVSGNPKVKKWKNKNKQKAKNANKATPKNENNAESPKSNQLSPLASPQNTLSPQPSPLASPQIGQENAQNMQQYPPGYPYNHPPNAYPNHYPHYPQGNYPPVYPSYPSQNYPQSYPPNYPQNYPPNYPQSYPQNYPQGYPPQGNQSPVQETYVTQPNAPKASPKEKPNKKVYKNKFNKKSPKNAQAPNLNQTQTQ